jgi:hypothetical protein
MILATNSDRAASLRWTAYALLIITSLASLAGRIMVVQASTGETPMLSANDRSRWCTIRSLVDYGTYQIDEVIDDRHPRTKRRFWNTIDRVRHVGRDGREHDYSSKPPLLSTLLASQYWVIQRLTGMRLDERPEYVMRLMLILTNVLPLAVYLLVLGVMVDRLGTSDGGRMLVMAVAAWGTFLTTFGVTLNNHIPAAISTLLAVFVVLAIYRRERAPWWYFVVAGLLAAFAATCELPALSLVAALGVALLWKWPVKTLLLFTPAALLIGAAFVGCNYLAHGTWRPAYAHRSDGPLLCSVARDQSAGEPAVGPLQSALAQQGIEITADAVIQPRSGAPDRYALWDEATQQRFALVVEPTEVRVHRWNNWYDYEGSYWTSGKRSPIDQGEPCRGIYAFHVLLGHHGVFSLTPIWIFSVVGLVMLLWRGESPLRGFAVLVLFLTCICLAFYIARPQMDRNYGGMTSGFRWLFWLIPLWTIALVPAADWLIGRRWAMVVAAVALSISVFSASYSALNPWVHPWIYTYWQYLGWSG